VSTNLIVGPLAKHIEPQQLPADFNQLLPCERGHLHACTDSRPVLHWSAFDLKMRMHPVLPRFAPRFGIFNPHHARATCTYHPLLGQLDVTLSPGAPRQMIFGDSHRLVVRTFGDSHRLVVRTKITGDWRANELEARYAGPIPAAMRTRVHALKAPLIVAPVTEWREKPQPVVQPDPYLVEWCRVGGSEHLHVDAWWDLSREELVLEEFITPAVIGPAKPMTEPANTTLNTASINSITYSSLHYDLTYRGGSLSAW